jgi:predicted membrane channel-forming protein YqfA (hemolysin III family)
MMAFLGKKFRVFPSIDARASSKLTRGSRAARMAVYRVVIGWMYVVLMMSVAEATNTTGTVLGAIVTFFLYGLLPVALVVYLMRTPQRRKALKAREATELREAQTAASGDPDAGGHAAGAAEAGGIAPVRKEP